ncbi:MAG TPA: glycine cleavage system protein H [Myxococcota bacterium]|nr:glycine cleavage system protein H [Myxococcota bacterium]
MSLVNNCVLPDDLLYHIDYNVWLRDNGDGTYVIGMTDLAQAMAGAVIHCRIKKVGKKVKAGKSLGTVESGKWVGPVKAPFACSVIAKNEQVENNAALLNTNPYGEGWMLRVQPEDPAAAAATLTSGDAVRAGFEAYMAERDFEGCPPADDDS